MGTTVKDHIRKRSDRVHARPLRFNRALPAKVQAPHRRRPNEKCRSLSGRMWFDHLRQIPNCSMFPEPYLNRLFADVQC